jgi:hypothetical protein
MIKIKIKNSARIVQKERGKLISMMGRFLDFEILVERKVVEEIEKTFMEKGIEAEITIEK